MDYNVSEISNEIPPARKGRPNKYIELEKIIQGKIKGLCYNCISIQDAQKLRNRIYKSAKNLGLSALLRGTSVYIVPKK